MSVASDARWAGLLRASSKAYLVAAACVAAVSLCLSWLLRLETLFRDGWRIQNDFFTQPLLDALWQNQGGHRILVPNLFFELDRLLVSGDNSLLVALACACKAGMAALLCIVIRRGDGDEDGGGRTVERFLTGFVLFAVFWLGDHVLLGWGIAAMTSVAQLAVVGALVCLVQGAVAASVALGVVATYSFGTGAGVWPALLACAFWMRMRPRVLAVIAAVAGVSLLVYARGLGRYGPAPDRVFEQGWDLAVYVASLLGSLVYHAISLRDSGVMVRELAPGDVALLVARVAGFAGLLVTGLCVAHACLPGSRPSRLRVLANGILLFSVAAGCIIAVGRFAKIPERFPLLSALDARYLTWSLLFWIGMVLQLGSGPNRAGRGREVVAGACALLLASLMLPAHGSGALALRARQLDVREAGLSLAVGAVDPSARTTLYRRPEFFDPVTAELRARRWNLFSLPLPGLVGRNLEEVFAIALDSGVRGSATRIEPLSRGWRIQGWAWDVRANTRPSGVVVGDAHGVIRGVAVLGRGPVGDLPALGIYADSRILSVLRRLSPDLPGELGLDFAWHGYVAGIGDPAEMSFYAVTRDGTTASPLDSKHALGALAQ